MEYVVNEVFESFEAKLTDCIGELSAIETQCRIPTKWTIQQIVEHLQLTYAATCSVLDTRLEKDRPTQSKSTLLQQCARQAVVGFDYFPRGLPAPRQVTPPEVSKPESGRQLVARTTELLRIMDAKLDEAASRFGERTRSASHLRLGPLNPPEWRRFHLAHGLHHIRQIQAIRDRA